MEFANDRCADDKEYYENLEEIKEQFEDLREEIKKTYAAYAKINRDAMEEAREEKVNKNSRVQNADAREEYDKEIKGLKEVRDGEMSKAERKIARKKAKEIIKMERKKSKELRSMEKRICNLNKSKKKRPTEMLGVFCGLCSH
jgi:hypothetical protein